MNENELRALVEEGVSGYDKIIYSFIVEKDFAHARDYAERKMDFIVEEYLDMSDEDLALIAYAFAMTGNFESAEATLDVLYEDGDVMKTVDKLNLFGSMAAALCFQKVHNKGMKRVMLEQTLSFAPDASHCGADEVVLAQAKEMLEERV